MNKGFKVILTWLWIFQNKEIHLQTFNNNEWYIYTHVLRFLFANLSCKQAVLIANTIQPDCHSLKHTHALFKHAGIFFFLFPFYHSLNWKWLAQLSKSKVQLILKKKKFDNHTNSWKISVIKFKDGKDIERITVLIQTNWVNEGKYLTFVSTTLIKKLDSL